MLLFKSETCRCTLRLRLNQFRRMLGYISPKERRLRDQGLSRRRIAAALNAEGSCAVTCRAWNYVQVGHELNTMP